jgi:small GTP-binding protein
MNNNEPKTDYSLKLLTIGESGVGKTCLLLRYTDNKFVKTHSITIGVDYKCKTIKMNNKSVTLKIWDTAGQERFRNMTQQYYKNADGILLVFDLTDRGTFEKLRDWMSQIQNFVNREDLSIILIGNKCEMETKEVTKEEAENMAEEFKIKYFETSAFTGENVGKAFETLICDILKITESEVNGASEPKGTIDIKAQQNKTEKEKKCC